MISQCYIDGNGTGDTGAVCGIDNAVNAARVCVSGCIIIDNNLAGTIHVSTRGLIYPYIATLYEGVAGVGDILTSGNYLNNSQVA